MGIPDNIDIELRHARLLIDIERELERARKLHPRPFSGAHEGWAILYEEVDELWREVRKKRESRDLSNMRNEAIQIAAMCIRFVEDVIDK